MEKSFKNIMKRVKEAEDNIQYVKDVLAIIKANDDLEIVSEDTSSSSWSFEDDMQIVVRSKKASKLLEGQDKFNYWYWFKITQRQKALFQFFIHQKGSYKIRHKNLSSNTIEDIHTFFEEVDKYLSKTTVKQLSKLKKFNK